MSKVTFPIHHTFGPLVTKEQWKLAFRLQFQPHRWKRGPETEELRRELSVSFGMSVALFATARESLLALFRALELTTGDEVIIQAFTCIAVPNAIHAAGGTAVYCDIDPHTLNLDLRKVQSRITPRTRAIICQHTFGIPMDTKKLRAVCDKRNLVLIEDCAHIIPDTGSATQLSLIQSPSTAEGIGVHGDALLFSFGRDKSISGVTGGAVLTRHSSLGKSLSSLEGNAESLSLWSILNLINYPIRYQCAKWLWKLPMGYPLAKLYLRWAQLLRLLPAVYTKSEKEGKMDIALHNIPNVCAVLALEQLRSISRFNAHRRKLAGIYHAAAQGGWFVPEAASKAVALIRFPVFVEDAEKLRLNIKREQVYLDDGWCGSAVLPRSCDPENAGYANGSCPQAEDIARHIVTLPLHPTMSEEQAHYLIHALQSYLG